MTGEKFQSHDSLVPVWRQRLFFWSFIFSSNMYAMSRRNYSSGESIPNWKTELSSCCSAILRRTNNIVKGTRFLVKTDDHGRITYEPLTESQRESRRVD